MGWRMGEEEGEVKEFSCVQKWSGQGARGWRGDGKPREEGGGQGGCPVIFLEMGDRRGGERARSGHPRIRKGAGFAYPGAGTKKRESAVDKFWGFGRVRATSLTNRREK